MRYFVTGKGTLVMTYPEANNRKGALTSGVNFDRSTSWGVCDGGVIVSHKLGFPVSELRHRIGGSKDCYTVTIIAAMACHSTE